MGGKYFSGEKGCAGVFRYAFNGQIKSDKLYGEEVLNTAQFWEYDTRLGRRWNLDPVPQISISDYAVFGLNPVSNVDIKGDKWKTKEDEKIASEAFRYTTKGIL